MDKEYTFTFRVTDSYVKPGHPGKGVIVSVEGRLDVITHLIESPLSVLDSAGATMTKETGKPFSMDRLVAPRDSISTVKNLMVAEAFGHEVLSQFPFHVEGGA